VIREQAASSMKRHLAQPVFAGIIKDFPAFHRMFGVHNLVHESPIIDSYSKSSESITVPPLAVRYILIFFPHYLLTYLLTPGSRVLLGKLTGFAASQEITSIYGTRKFLTVLTSARHLSLS
jgi:hypothetical protein